MPALQRARRRFGPRQPHDPCRAGRGHLRGERVEDLDDARAPRPVRDPPRPHRPARRAAPRHLLLPLPDGPRGDHDTAGRRHDRALVLRGVLRGRPSARRPPRRRGERRLAPRARHPRQRAACPCRAAARCGAPGRPPATSWPSSGPAEASATRSHASASRPSTWKARCCASSSCGRWARGWPAVRPVRTASVQKVLSDQHGQHVMGLAKDLSGTDGMLAGSGPPGGLAPAERTDRDQLAADLVPGVEPVWHYGFLFSPALTIGGGTWRCSATSSAGTRPRPLPREP